VKDFTPISSMGNFDFLFCVNASSSFQSMADFVKTAREKPGTLNIATINIGSSQNLTAGPLKLTAIRITKDRLAKSTPKLVALAAQAIARHGVRPATPQEARQVLHLRAAA
jgi:hypothetical protein